jgi:hypothetical protein
MKCFGLQWVTLGWLWIVGQLIPGCLVPQQRHLSLAKLPVHAFGGRHVRLLSVEVEDLRTLADKKEIYPEVKYFIPLLVFNMLGMEGNYKPDSKFISSDAPAELKTLVENAISQSGLFVCPIETDAGNQPDPKFGMPYEMGADKHMGVRLRIGITRLYGVTHSISDIAFSLGGAMALRMTFAPYGYCSARVELLSKAGKLLMRRYISGRFNPDAGDLANVGEEYIMDQLTMAAVQACGDMVGNLVKAIETALANHQPKPARAHSGTHTFYIVRAIPCVGFYEVAGIDYSTGRVVSSEIVTRRVETFSGPNEWVLDPYQNSGSRWAGMEYRKLLKFLSSKYHLRYVTNVRVAHFFGGSRDRSQPLHRQAD